MFHIAVINESTVYKLGPNVVQSLQDQVHVDFAPEWGTDAELRLLTNIKDKLPGEWVLAILDNSDQAGALGYHDLTSDGQPQGLVFAKTTLDAGLSITVTISHELLEMLADPDINRSCEYDNAQGQPSEMYALEVCDAPEDDQYGYTILDVMVSDFVHRAWFIQGATGPYDKMGHITAPLQILSGGYIGEMNVTTQGWTQLDSDLLPDQDKTNIRSTGRLVKRNKARSSWIRSDHGSR